MTSIRKIVRLLAAVALVGAGLVGTSQASTITVVPGTQTIGVGGNATVDIVLSGLTANETVGAFSFLLSFNDTLLDGVTATTVNDPDGKMGALPLDLSLGFPGGSNSPLDVYFLADAIITQPNLKALQGTGFRLATVNFTGLVQGLSPLTLSFSPATGIFLANFDGITALQTPTIVNGEICVDNAGGPCTSAEVPEPATLSLLGAGLAAFVARRRRQARSEV